jgi:hypothetical protein
LICAGYGETPRDKTGWLTPKRSVADIINVLSWVAAQNLALRQRWSAGRGAAMAGWRRNLHLKSPTSGCSFDRSRPEDR